MINTISSWLDRHRHLIIASAIILPIYSLILYYIYEVSYASYFSIPMSIVGINVSHLLIHLFFIVVVSFFTLAISYMLAPFKYNPWIPLAVIAILIIFTAALYFFIGEPFYLNPIFFILAFFVIYYFSSFFAKEVLFVGINLTIIFFLVVLPLFEMGLGHMYAQNKTSFYSCSVDKTKYAIMAAYGNILICSPYDERNTQIKYELKIINPENSPVITVSTTPVTLIYRK